MGQFESTYGMRENIKVWEKGGRDCLWLTYDAFGRPMVDDKGRAQVQPRTPSEAAGRRLHSAATQSILAELPSGPVLLTTKVELKQKKILAKGF